VSSPLVHRVRAVNEPGSSNLVHEDEFARRLGFRAGLVPGVAIYGYLAEVADERWGGRWLRGGTMSARFLKPVYDGEEVTVSGADGDGGLELEARNPAGELCANGRATLHEDLPLPDPARYPEAPLPREPGPAAFQAGQVLGSLRTELQLPDPGWPARLGNQVLLANVALPPWIHVETRTRYLRPVADAEPMTVRALVAGLRERRGHRFVDLDVLVADGAGEAVAQLRHVAIYELAQLRSPAG
jgi:acyl dehydratase